MLEYPTLKDQIIALDTETRDPNLKTRGPGWVNNDGELLGVSIATDTFKQYYAFGHAGGNVDQGMTLHWLQRVINDSRAVVFHNAQYDLGWLSTVGITVPEDKIHDTMLMAQTMDEYRNSYSLDSIGADYVDDKKDYDLLNAKADDLGIRRNQIITNLHKFPARFVAPYAEQDAALTLKLFKLFNEKPEPIYELERALLPMFVAMRKRGVRVDLDKAQKLSKELLMEERLVEAKLNRIAGMQVNVYANRSIAEAYDKLGCQYTRTDKGNPSFTAEFFASANDPLSPLIHEVRTLNKIRSGFIDGVVLKFGGKTGRIHPTLNQMGAVSGRVSSKTPNIQQLPARHPVLGPKVRSLFIPDEGDQWACLDYSQQEPRLVVHYAHILNLRGAEEAKRKYSEDNADYHQMVADMAGIDRFSAKTINLGLSYGMGIKKLSKALGHRAEEVLHKYRENVPFVRALSDMVSNKADKAGEINTILGRKCRFPLWEPTTFNHGLSPVKGEEEAYEKFKHPDGTAMTLKRSFTYRALNRLIQGSAADQTKKAMLIMWQQGFTPLFPVHDEINLSTCEDSAQICKEIMENAVQLVVPSKVDMGLGDSWATAK